MRTAFALLLILSVYLAVYYRLMANLYAEKQPTVKQNMLRILCSLPPYHHLPDKGQKYARRYWITLLILFVSLMLVTFLPDSITVKPPLPP